jgi:hypothetical protein
VDFKLPDDFKPITPQRVFDAAWNAFVIGDAQPARSSAGGCSYRNSKGDKCAIGLLIPDGHPAQDAQNSVGKVIDKHPELFGASALEYEGLATLARMQIELHDSISLGNEDDAYWTTTQAERRERYTHFARQHNLTIPSSEVQS